MVSRIREIYIRINNVKEIITLLEEIKAKQNEIKELFREIDEIIGIESKIIDEWGSTLDEILLKVDHITI